MARGRLVGALCFALLAGLGAAPWLLVSAPLFGYAAAAALFGLASVVWHPLFVAPSLRRGLLACALAALLGAPVLLFASRPAVVLALAPIVLSVVRSGLLYPRPWARALFFELGFNLSGLAAAAFFYDAGILGTCFAVWVFWLVQAAFVLLPQRALGRVASEVDPFERARASALELLDAPPR